MPAPKKKTLKTPDFERSNELKTLFNELSEEWYRTTRFGQADLAERCGVSLQYLSHVGRYGRVPSKPILTLLAFNLAAKDPAAFYRAAHIKEPWPYEPDVGLRARAASDSGLLSVNLDMHGFANAIRDIVRAEIQPKRFEELLGKRPLRVGLNRGQFFFFDEKDREAQEGFFPELMRSLTLSLHCEVAFVDVLHSDFAQKLERGEIDCYGPVYRTAPRIGHGLYANPFCHVTLSGLGRTRKAANLSELPNPKRISDLRSRDYVIAVHRDSMAHHFAESELGIPSSRLLPCDGPEEAVERIVLTSLPRPAHIVLTDSPFARRINREHPSATNVLFANTDADVPLFEDTLAVRQDWPSLLSVLNESLEYLGKSGALTRLFSRTVSQNNAAGITL